jgi:nitrite reductase/ring-hydroxylating ferredoxin subunit
MLGRQIVAFKTTRGQVAVMDANCSHMGADLGCGKVVGETIQCPFHNWKYAADGHCAHIPGASQIPRFARQAAYPSVERHGYVFFFNGREALFPLPFFFDLRPEDFVAGEIFSYTSDCAWFVNAAHGYDVQHFDAVHDRKLLAPPTIDRPSPFAMRNRYHAEVLGHTRPDRLLKWLAGSKVEISITNWGGNFVLITGTFDRAHSRFLIATQPLDGGRTLCEGIVFAPRLANPIARLLLERPGLAVRRWFTHGYLADETRRLLGTRYDPGRFISHDRAMIDFFNWAAALPQQSAPAAPSAFPQTGFADATVLSQ